MQFKEGLQLSPVAAAVLNVLKDEHTNPLSRWKSLLPGQKSAWIASTYAIVIKRYPDTVFRQTLTNKLQGQIDNFFLANPLPEHNAPENRSQEHNPTAKHNMSDRAVEFVTLVDGTNVKSLSKDQTIRAIKANLKSIEENRELNAVITSTTLSQDIAEREHAHEALKTHLESFASAAAPAAAAPSA
jgi:hypothetical protein